MNAVFQNCQPAPIIIRSARKYIFIALGLALACFFTTQAASRPNIVLIMSDDLGVEGIGAYGCTEYATPRLDQLAEKGMRFEHCYSLPICTPSRVQIMTGRYNHRNYAGFGVLPKTEITFGNLLREVGYRTCIAGKWQLAGDANTPDHFGFDEYCLWFLYPPAKKKGGQRQGRRYWEPYEFIENGKKKKVAKDAYGPDLLCNYITDFIGRQKKDKPFFIYFPMLLTHAPFDPTPDSPRNAPRAWAQKKYKDDTYMKDMVAYMDKSVGRILDALEAGGFGDNTLVIFTSDNGTDKAVTTETINGPVRGGKGLLTDAGTHVPLIACYPGKNLGGDVCNDLIDFSDFLPTLAETAGATLPKDRVIDGISFLPQLKGKKGQPRAWTFTHYWKGGRKKKGAQEFIRNHLYKFYDDGRFYNIKTDPEEKHPIKEPTFEERNEMNKLKEKLESFHH